MDRLKKVPLLSFLISFLLVSNDQIYDPSWCGNKHANLVKLETIVRTIANVEVPAFFGVGTGRVEEFLRKHNAEIFRSYKNVIVCLQQILLPKSQGMATRIKNLILGYRIKTLDSIQALINDIQNNVKSLFLAETFEFTQQEKLLLEKCRKAKRFVMVRSTGIEDSQTVANAGGNVSVAYVEPTPQAVQEAMADVVASYFGMQSLKNRIMGGEDIDQSPLCIPVLIQMLIGEELQGAAHKKDIPISGVAFTTQQTLSGKDISITEINAAYGHGEGVVANRVVADRYYGVCSLVNPQRVVWYPMLFQKHERLVPAYDTAHNKYILQSQANDESLMYKNALNEQQLATLYAALKHIEQAYGQPMDVEFVVCDTTVYIVQARPAMHHAVNPSYVALEQVTSSAIDDHVAITPLVTGTAQVAIITDPSQVIVAQTLDEADQMSTSATCRAVFVSQWASSLSHAAVNFTSHGIPCFYVTDFAQLKNVIAKVSSVKPLLVDVQRRVCLFWKTSIEAYEPYIRQGWFEHPVEGTVSVMGYAKPKQSSSYSISIPQDVRLVRAMEDLKKAVNAQDKLVLLQTVEDMAFQRFTLTERRLNHIGLAQDITQQYQEFKELYCTVFKELRACIDQGKDHYAFLFYYKMLQAVLFQPLDSALHIGTYTYTSFLNELYSRQVMYMALKKVGSDKQLGEALAYVRYCSDTLLTSLWKEVIDCIQQLRNESDLHDSINYFFAMLKEYEIHGYAALWFATEFYRFACVDTAFAKLSASEKKEATECFIKQFGQEHRLEELTMIKLLTEQKHQLVTVEHSNKIGAKTVQEIQQLWNALEKSILFFTSPAFVQDFQQSSLLVKMMALDCMQALIHGVDMTIKSVKTNAYITEQDRITRCKDMLIRFKDLCICWLNNIMPEAILQYHWSWPLQAYIIRLEELSNQIIANSHDVSMFSKSASFAANAAVIGAGTAFDRHYPNTFEDLFMLIHQNSLVALAGTYASFYAGKSLSECISAPQLVYDIVAYFESPECSNILDQGGMKAPQRIGVEYAEDTFVVRYNVGMNNHSSMVDIVYNKVLQECSIRLQFLGESRNRWEQVALMAEMSKDLSHLALTEDVFFDYAAGIVTWAWRIDNIKDCEKVALYLQKMSKVSWWGNQYLLDSSFMMDIYCALLPLEKGFLQALYSYQNKYGTSSLVQRLIADAQQQVN